MVHFSDRLLAVTVPHAFDFDPKIVRTCVEILAMFFDRIFRPEDFVFALDPKIPGNHFIDMEGKVHAEPPKMEPPQQDAKL